MAKKPKYLEELQQIMVEHQGHLRPEDVVAFAANPETALHGAFTWDDSEAAHQWRLQQARQLIRVAVVVLPGTERTKYRAFVSLKEDRYDNGGYRVLAEVLGDKTLREVLLAEAKLEMQTFMAKYEKLTELAGVFLEMEKILKKRRASTRKDKRAPAVMSAAKA
jgi:hypothetical protein